MPKHEERSFSVKLELVARGQLGGSSPLFSMVGVWKMKIRGVLKFLPDSSSCEISIISPITQRATMHLLSSDRYDRHSAKLRRGGQEKRMLITQDSRDTLESCTSCASRVWKSARWDQIVRHRQHVKHIVGIRLGTRETANQHRLYYRYEAPCLSVLAVVRLQLES